MRPNPPAPDQIFLVVRHSKYRAARNMIQATKYVNTVANHEQILVYTETIYIFIDKGKGATPDRIILVVRHL